MRRAILAIVATTAGLVLLLSFKTGGQNALRPPAALSQAPAGSASGSGPSPSASASPAQGKSQSSSGKQTVSGPSVDTPYGPVQVQVTVNGSKLVDIQPLQLPQSQRRDIEIDNYAVPQLMQEALQAQSAQIDTISGATYTSDGFIQSLQAALQKAGLA